MRRAGNGRMDKQKVVHLIMIYVRAHLRDERGQKATDCPRAAPVASVWGDDPLCKLKKNAHG